MAEILKRTSEDTQWVCYQTTFSKSNPVAAYPVDSQFYFENQTFVQFGTLDSTGKRLVDKDGISNLETVFTLKFMQDLTSKTFFKGQTFCAHYDGNDFKYDGKTWTDQIAKADEADEG